MEVGPFLDFVQGPLTTTKVCLRNRQCYYSHHFGGFGHVSSCTLARKILDTMG